MPVTYSIDTGRRLVLTTAEGCVTFDDCKQHQDRLLADPTFDPHFDQLIDTTAATRVDLTSQEARVLAQRRVVAPEARRAFVATQAHIYGFGRMLEIYHEDLLEHADMEVFQSMDEALKWLERSQHGHS